MQSSFEKNPLFIQENGRLKVFPLKYNGLISTICQMAVKCVNHVPNSHAHLTFKGSYSGHCWPEASFLPSSISRLSHFPPITHILRCGGILSALNYLSSYLFLAVITLDEPGNRSLWRARNTLQEGTVVLCRIHHPVIGHIKLFWLKEKWSKRFLVWRALQKHQP